MEVAYDSAKWLIIRRWEFMGLLFTPARNKYIVMGEKRGFARGFAIGYVRGYARGYARVAARFAAWFARKDQAEKDGRAFTEPPPFLSATPPLTDIPKPALPTNQQPAPKS